MDKVFLGVCYNMAYSKIDFFRCARFSEAMDGYHRTIHYVLKSNNAVILAYVD